MSDLIPQIVYPSGGSSTLTFLYPPISVPAYVLKAQRHDNFASSGVKEVIVENVSSFMEINQDWLVLGTDVAAWNSFYTQCALTGLYWDYYPQASVVGNGNYTTYRLVENTWKAAWKSLGLFQFKSTWRQAVPQITVFVLPNATHGSSYSQTLTAVGGTGTLTWSVTAGALPSPMTLSSGGVLSGTPTSAGTSNFTVTVTDSAQYVPQTHSMALQLVVN